MSYRAKTDGFRALACRESYYEFFKEFWPVIAAETLVDSWYIKTLCDELQIISERVFLDQPKEYDLIWNCPPGTSKSSVVSVGWQPWIWTRMPSARFISGSFSERLALDLSRKSRDIVKCEKYRAFFPEIQLREDQDAKGYFANTKGGMRYAVGVGGSVIGMHAHFIAVDDPLDPQAALSDLMLAESNTWMSETLSRRKVNVLLTPTVLIMQRLHQDDPTGHTIEKGGRIRHCCIPADLSWDVLPTEWRSRYINGLLDPNRLPQQALDEAYKELLETGYAGQYGQCLVAGTLIQTQRGSVPIENVSVGDLVFTRDGLKPVLWSGPTKVVDEISSALFANGSVLIGTPDHPIWTDNREFVGIANLSGGDYNRVFADTQEMQPWEGPDHQTQKLLSLTASPISGNQESRTLETENTEKTGISIGTSINSTTGTSPLAITSITKTRTQATIELKILNASLLANMHEDILCPDSQKLRSFLVNTVFWVRREFGDIGRLPRVSLTIASNVGRVLSQDDWAPLQSSVPVHAKKKPALGSLLIDLVRLVERSLLLEIRGLGSVQENAGVRVYDLTVGGLPEFYANGILVHNSPIPRGGAKFKVDRLNYAHIVPQKWKRGPVRYWDKAGTKGGGAFTVGVEMGIDLEERVWILDVVRVQLDSGAREKLILNTAKIDKAHYPKILTGVEQEPGSSGQEAAQSTVKRLTLAGLRAIMDRASGDKETRAEPLSEMVNMGNVVLLNGLWNKEFVAEMRFFPMSKYKDQIDAASGAFSMLTKTRHRIGVYK